MNSTLRSQYVGFTVNDTYRIYTMRVRRLDGELQEFRIAIDNRSFLSNRVRYQDAAEICFLKLRRELNRCGEESMPASQMEISDAELDEYREAHTKKPKPSGKRASSES